MARIAREGAHEPVKSRDVNLPSRRQLIEHRTEMWPELARALEEALERLLRILELLHMGQEPAGLDREEKFFRCTLGPPCERGCLRQAIEAVVDFDRVEDG